MHKEIDKKYLIPLVGYHNKIITTCLECDYFIRDPMQYHTVGFANTDFGIMAVIECPSCFGKFYFHARYDYYRYFIEFIEHGLNKHFKEEEK